ncbi:hypothetical protein HBA92_00535 [Ochrobactrum sp. MR28]|nr:hypothetical protein [Ochrobactrum sp. MR28]MBX8814750.1 hypothetical protein [Ochrobactrum sp. MR31]
MADNKQQTNKSTPKQELVGNQGTSLTAKINILFNGSTIAAGEPIPSEMNVTQRKELIALGAI